FMEKGNLKLVWFNLTTKYFLIYVCGLFFGGVVGVSVGYLYSVDIEDFLTLFQLKILFFLGILFVFIITVIFVKGMVGHLRSERLRRGDTYVEAEGEEEVL
uniref:hypothetical protein n=1 Tax=Rothia nasimurium TaxID=85336 RepID=UPI001F1D7146